MVGAALGSCRLASVYGAASAPPASAATRFSAQTPMAAVVTHAAGAPAGAEMPRARPMSAT
eukprot:scaffold1375_cov30-Phaeocystis_antarctica.AAC.1